MRLIYGGVALFVAGLGAGLQLEVPMWEAGCALGAAVVALGLGLYLRQRHLGACCLCCFFLLLGLGSGLRTGPSAAQQLQPYYGQQLLVQGRLEPLSVKRGEGYCSFILATERVQAGQRAAALQLRLRVSLKEAAQLPEAGRIVVQGRLQPLIGFYNPGGFDAELYNRINNLGGRLAAAQLCAAQTELTLADRLALLNLGLRRKIEQALGSRLGAVLSGMVLGGSRGLEEDIRDSFTANGLAHLLSVSGTHLVLLTGLLTAVLGFLPAKLRKIIITGVLLLYAGLCGLGPPVLRALVMSAVLLWGGAGAERGILLCLTGMLLLLAKPLWLLDIGFQLSFGAAAGLLWLLPACKRWLPAWLPQPLQEGMAVTLAAQLAVIPWEIMYFHQFSLISIISNIVLVPVLELAALLTLAGCLLPGGAVLLQGAGFLTEQLLLQAQWLGSLPWSTVVIGALPLYCGLLYYALLLVAADVGWLQLLSNGERRRAMLALALALGGTLVWQQLRPQPLTAYFLDVGQGDCAVLVTPSRQLLIVDTGGLASLPVGSRIIAPFIRYLGYREAEVLLLSHYDQDHAGGTASLLQHLRVNKLLLPRERLQQAQLELWQPLLQMEDVMVLQAERGLTLELGQDTVLQVLDVPRELASGNEASTLAAVRGRYGSLLFTGDMDEQRERQLQHLEHYSVLKAGHHGSRYSSSEAFLRQLRPQLSVISCGQGNRYGHPHRDALARLAAYSDSIARTDQLGCIKVVFDAAGIKWYSYRYEKNKF